MNAVHSQITLNTISDLAELVEFIQQHGDRLGAICSLMREHAQIEHSPVHPKNSDVASSLINWFYLLDDARVTVIESTSAWNDEPLAHTTIHGRLNGRGIKVYTAIYGEAGAYLLSLEEVTVHALRRVQVGDLPEVVAA